MTPPANSSTGTHRFSTSLIAGLWGVAWTVGNLWWIASDHLLRDGDEEGHVGAAELFREDLLGHDWGGFLSRLWVGDMGDYPSLYAALTGAWWWATGTGEPGTAAVRGLGLLWVLVAAGAVGLLVGRHDRRAGLLAAGLTTLLPLPVGLSRHFMPEGMLVAAVAVTVLTAVRAAERPSPGRALALGAALGCGLLVKQTFVLLAGPPVAVALVQAGRRSLRPALLAFAVAGAIAGPWYLLHLQEQLAYGGRSAGSAVGASPLLHLLWYPAAMAVIIAGPALCLAALPGVRALGRGSPRRHLARVALAWLLGGMLLLALVPKKYPRLAAPLAPAVAALAGLALVEDRRTRWPLAGLTAVGAAWLSWRSLVPSPTLPAPLQAVVPGCPQQWLRAPVDDDLGMSAVAAAIAAAPPGRVRVQSAPEIPCALQTTPSWDQHLSPYLRRVGIERDLVFGPGGEPAVLTIQWQADLPGRVPAASDGVVPVPRLGGHFELDPPGG